MKTKANPDLSEGPVQVLSPAEVMGLSYNVYLNSARIYGCKTCKTHLANHDDIASRNFRGQHGKAYLFKSVVNINQSEASERSMTTGRHVVRDISCKQCKETVGWKYDKAYEQSEKYKEGMYILEAELLCTVRVPFADGTVMKAPGDIEDKALVLMADIFPTGYFAAHNAFKDLTKAQMEDSTVVVIGCGPVGLCAVIAAETYKPKHLFAVDSVQSRLELARSLGAESWDFQTDREGFEKRIKEVTNGRGADAVIEVVGLSPALKMGFEILRPWGIISSVGVHNAEIPWTGNQAYGKNLKIQMGRCPVRSIFPKALDLLRKKQHLLGFMADKLMPLSQAVEGYEIFDNMKAQKVIFEAQK